MQPVWGTVAVAAVAPTLYPCTCLLASRLIGNSFLMMTGEKISSGHHHARVG